MTNNSNTSPELITRTAEDTATTMEKQNISIQASSNYY